MTPGDFGPIYTETDLSRFPVEPWNTFSNLIFLIVLIVFARRTRLNIKRHPLIVAGLPILFVGFLGGTIFHATRSANIWLVLDFMPIGILSLMAAFYFWRSVIGSTPLALLAVPLPLIFTSGLRALLPFERHASISVGYIGLALLIVLPAGLDCRKRGYAGAAPLLGAVASFALAITFRFTDKLALLPMGTHFLWHLFGGLSTYLILLYTYMGDLERNAIPTEPPGGIAR